MSEFAAFLFLRNFRHLIMVLFFFHSDLLSIVKNLTSLQKFQELREKGGEVSSACSKINMSYTLLHRVNGKLL